MNIKNIIRQDVIKSIYACYESNLKIEVRNEKYSNYTINVALEKLLYERHEIAKMFVESRKTK